MILGVADPYFNEPGHDSNRGAMGMSASRQYNSTIRAQTLDAAVAPALQGPKGGLPGYATFGEALQLHFWHKREALASVVDRWVGEAAPGDEKSRISSLAAKIKPLLGAMQPPQQQAAADMDLG